MAAVPALFRMRDENGVLEPGAKLYTYIAGTTTPLAVFTDNALSVPHANPAIADSAGRLVVWFDSTKSYKVSIKKADDSGDLFPPFDNYSPGDDDILQFIGTDAAAAAIAAAESAAAALVSQTGAAASAAAALSSETNAATSETNAASSEAAAATSESNAATSETNAAQSETDAATSASSASSDASAAAASASAASTSETNAGASEDNAELHDISSGLSEQKISSRILPGVYASAAAAAAADDAAVGSQYLGTDNGYYVLTDIGSPASIAVPSLSTEQSDNLAAVPALNTFVSRIDDSGTSGGSTNTYTYTSATDLELGAYADGVKIGFIVSDTNTGASTLNVDGVGAVSLKKRFNVDVRAGDLVAGQRVEAVYDATNSVFQIVSPIVNANLSANEALTGAADKLDYYTSASAKALADFPAFGRTLVGSANAAAARASLDLEPGTDVQAYNALLAAIAGVTPTDGVFLVGNGSTFVAESGATARASLGVPAEPTTVQGNPSSVIIDGTGGKIGIAAGSISVLTNNTADDSFGITFSAFPFVAVSTDDTDTNAGDNCQGYALSTTQCRMVNGSGGTRIMSWVAVGPVA